MKTINDIEKAVRKKDFIINGIMKSQGLYCLVARPKVGKSLLALQLANSVATGTTFLGFDTNPSPVLYISTEMDSSQLRDRIKKMKLNFNENNFFLIEQEPNERKLNLMDLQLDIMTFSQDYGGKLVIIDMLCGFDLNIGYDLNNYQDIGQTVLPKLRDLCKRYSFTILFIHHLNKNNTSLGSTALEGSVDGKITLKEDSNIKNKYILTYESRDYENFNLILKRDSNLLLQISEYETDDLNVNLIMFLNYAISQKEFDFVISDITSKLQLKIAPSTFGKLLNNNIDNLKKEGLHIELKRTATDRIYHAKYVEPVNENSQNFH